MKFGFVAKHRGAWPVGVLCEALGVSRSGFYAWRTRPGSERARTDALILVTVRTSFLLSDRTYGARRMVDDVRDAGMSVGASVWVGSCGRKRSGPGRAPPITGRYKSGSTGMRQT